MPRSLVMVVVVVAAFGLGIRSYVAAQDAASPAATPGTADQGAASFAATPELCATPQAEAEQEGTPAGTPVAVLVSTPVQSQGVNDIAPSPVVLYECGTPAATSGDDTGDGDAVLVEMVDVAFAETELAIAADTDVTLRFANNGAAVHNFKIDDPDVFSGDLAPGAESDLVVNLPAGTYEYYCSIPGHAPAGMVGTLTVQ